MKRILAIAILGMATIALGNYFEVLNSDPPEPPENPPDDGERDKTTGSCASGDDYEIEIEKANSYTCEQSERAREEGTEVCICSFERRAYLVTCKDGKKTTTRKLLDIGISRSIFPGQCPGANVSHQSIEVEKTIVIGGLTLVPQEKVEPFKKLIELQWRTGHEIQSLLKMSPEQFQSWRQVLQSQENGSFECIYADPQEAE